MYGSAINGANLPGHVLSATFNPSSGSSPTWNDLTLNPVVNDTHTLNYYGFDISSITIDAHDATGNTVYVTVAGIESARAGDSGRVPLDRWRRDLDRHHGQPARRAGQQPGHRPAKRQHGLRCHRPGRLLHHRGGELRAIGRIAGRCSAPDCPAPRRLLSAPLRSASAPVLVAATYGRGIWQTPLWTAGTGMTSASASPASLAFPSQAFDTTSSALTVTLENTGSLALPPTSISMSGSFSETDNCVNATVAAGASCAIQVTFTPQATGPLTGQMTIYANVYGGQLTVDLNGTGAAAGVVTLTPSTVSFGQVEDGTTSTPLQSRSQIAARRQSPSAASPLPPRS